MKKTFQILVCFIIIVALGINTVLSADASETKDTSGGEKLQKLYENEKEISNFVLQEKQQSKEELASSQSIYLDNVMKVNATYSRYYGGSYVDDEKVIVLLTDTNEEIKNFVEKTIGTTPTYVKCDVTISELNSMKEEIVDYWSNYIEGDDVGARI